MRLSAADGVGLRAALWRARAPRAHCLFLSGRTETLEKVAVPAAELLARGISVASLDWRGQGLSNRLTGEARMGHVGDFAEYQLDLAALLGDARVAALAGPRLVIGHSMGGAIALRALEPGRGAALDRCAGAVLSAPMLGIAMKPPVRLVAGLAVRFGNWLGQGESWLPVGQPERFYVLEPFEGNVLTGDETYYRWLQETLKAEPRLGLGWPSIGWLGAAGTEMDRLATAPAPQVPLLFLLGSEEAVVDGAAVRAGAARIGAELVEIPGGRHEVLIDTAEVRARAWAAIDRFLARVLPA